MDKMTILDHGYLLFVESWGSDESIICAARMSTGKGFLGWEPGVCPTCVGTGFANSREDNADSCNDCGGKGKIPGDLGLLRRLWVKKHATPFEMAGMVVEVQAPIMVFREWHRHRTQCLAGSAMVWFTRPDNGRPRQVSMEQLARSWYPKCAKRRRRDQSPMSLVEHNRSRIAGMFVRMHSGGGLSGLSSVTDVIVSGEKPLYRLHANGRTIEASADHLFETPDGWYPLSELSGREVFMTGAAGDADCSHNFFPELTAKELSEEEWRAVFNGLEVSTLGRVRSYWGQGVRIKRTEPYLKEATINFVGRAVVSHRNAPYQVSRLVWTAFHGDPGNAQVLHKDDNALDNRLFNLYLGDDTNNARDRVRNGRQQRLKIVPRRVQRIEAAGSGMTYDLAVAAPQHNFVANGFVTHNSYNEMSARYVPLPDVNYVPTVERLLMNQGTKNKQAGTADGAGVLTAEHAAEYLKALEDMWKAQQAMYESALRIGVPKELARVHLGVGRYSRMRASANLRNWLGFLVLRMAEDAQYEIRMYAHALCDMLKERFPRTLNLFLEGKSG